MPVQEGKKAPAFTLQDADGNKVKLADSPALKAFVDYYLSDTGLVVAVDQTGYVELPTDMIDATRSTWESASGSTGATAGTGSTATT